MIAASASACDASMTSVAPSFAAMCRRIGTRSLTMARTAPWAMAACSVTRPMGPAPSTATVSPAVTPERRAAHTPTASGSSIAPSSSDMLSGSGKRKSDGQARYSANAPCTGGAARKTTSGHML